jgi:hypothetical protein
MTSDEEKEESKDEDEDEEEREDVCVSGGWKKKVETLTEPTKKGR